MGCLKSVNLNFLLLFFFLTLIRISEYVIGHTILLGLL